jgi:cytochrome c oxidase assembly protein subunit 15
MLILVAAVALAWRAQPQTGSRPEATYQALGWAVRGLLLLGALTIFAGTAATAAGPHAGGKPSQTIRRLDFMGSGTMDWTIHRHGELAALLGMAAVALWIWARQRTADARLRRALTALCLVLGVQGALGLLQYATHLPTELVWLHVTLGTLAWLCVLWSVAAASALVPGPLAQAHKSVAPFQGPA